MFKNQTITNNFKGKLLFQFFQVLYLFFLETLYMQIERIFKGQKNYNLKCIPNIIGLQKLYFQYIFSVFISLHLVIMILLITFGSPLHLVLRRSNFSLLHILHSHLVLPVWTAYRIFSSPYFTSLMNYHSYFLLIVRQKMVTYFNLYF